MSTEELLREAHYLHGESWFRIYDEQPDYLDEAENALRYHLALRVMVTRLSSALRASEAEREGCFMNVVSHKFKSEDCAVMGFGSLGLGVSWVEK